MAFRIWHFLVPLLAYIKQVDGECGYASCPTPLPGHINVHLVPHTHDDVGWLKTVDQYYYGSRNNIQKAGVQYILDSVIQALLKDPDRRFIYVESAFLWRWWGEQNEQMKTTVRQLVDQGRLEFISGGWSMNDEAAAHYSAIIDNMALGIKFLQDEFGSCGRPRVGWQIDPFGHSREYANILAKFGFDGLFLGRIDYADKTKRMVEKKMEMVWLAGEGGKEGEIFTGVNYHTYSPPPGFCFDTLCQDVIMDNKQLEDYNLDEKLAKFIAYTRQQAASYTSGNIMMTMGEDFNYQDANMWYKNLDKLIKYMNMTKDDHKIHLMYSTPSCYLKAIKQSGVPLQTKSDDFFPYASDPHAYWSGYFTSRSALKGMIRNANSLLQACKQVSSASIGKPEDPRLEIAKRSVAVNQHHDAVTGTAKQHVTDDYYLALHKGMQACHQVISESLGSEKCTFNEWCPFLNISQCAFTEQRPAFSMAVYNPLPRREVFYIRIPVNNKAEYFVTDISKGLRVETNLIPIPQALWTLPGRESKAKYELVVRAEVDGLSTKYFNVQRQNSAPPAHVDSVKELDLSSGRWRGVSIGNNDIKIQLGSNGEVKRIKTAKDGDVNIQMGFEWYQPAVGDNTEWLKRSSGAYIFRPNHTTPNPIGKPKSAYLIKGSLVNEIHQEYTDWISQVMRVYRDHNFIEMEWMVGPIPVNNGGKEVIIKYASDIATGNTFLTDTNGRGLIERIRNHRDTWTLNLTEPVASNYFPLNSRIGVKSKSGQSMWILTDRSEGGSSLRSGEVELMVHRRLLHDDAFGVGEALDELAFGKGLVVRGKHILKLCENCEDETAELANQVFAKPVVHFGEACSDTRMDEKSINLKLNWPSFIKLLTLEKWESNKVLVRLENVLTEKKTPFTVNLADLFPNKSITAVQHMTLDGNKVKSQAVRDRFSWNTDSNHVPPLEHKDERNSNSESQLDIELQPGFIETLLLQFSK